MVGHQAVGDDRNRVFFKMFLDLLQQENIILVVAKNVRPIRASVVNVIILVGKKGNVSPCHKSPPADEGASHFS